MSGAGARKFRAPGRHETEFCILVSNSCVASVCRLSVIVPSWRLEFVGGCWSFKNLCTAGVELL